MLSQKTIIFLIITSLILQVNCFGQESLAEKLGFTKNDKLLIIHSDDVGVSHSENSASITAMRVGMVNSGSIMMPCPWVSEIASYARQNPTKDFGLHLTLTSEWETMKWGPVAAKNEVKSLLNKNGYFYAGCEDLQKNATLEEVEIELRAQIEKAIKMGINPSHLDSHMGCLIYKPEYLQIYLKLGNEYKIPAMIDKASYENLSEQMKGLITDKTVLLENIMTAFPSDFSSGMDQYYEKVLTNLKPGVQIVLIHTAFNDAEMQALTINHPEWGAAWRQEDFDFFTSERCKEIIKKEQIKLVTWRQIQQVIYNK